MINDWNTEIICAGRGYLSQKYVSHYLKQIADITGLVYDKICLNST